ncbi:MAG TPA: hypothetical protein VFJ71_08870 [Candidatus Limnocylindrales bacterium]|nr:hypothetical protein [Candidatus Limnocylindrales bacterium]
MILRVVSGRIRPGQLHAVTESFRAAYSPVAARTPGLNRFVVATRPDDDGGHHLAAMTIWDSVELALAAYGGDLTRPRTLDGRDHGAALDRVDYYELGAGRTRIVDVEPAFLRLTAGTVARGLDADIQQELRLRLPDLPDEAVEAYVGRRVLEGSVEIAFASTWTSVPEGIRLDAPIWPAISDRYERFRMEVHEIALAGVGPSGLRTPD